MALQAAVGIWPYTEITCCSCSVVFGLPDTLYQQRKTDHHSFWCPNGHQQYFTGETTEQKRIKQLEADLRQQQDLTRRAQLAREWAESRTRSANIAAGKAKAEKNRLVARVHAGVCPHCRRTFTQLARHMKSKHP